MEIKLTIDNQEVVIEEGKTLLDAARENGEDIPTICFHELTTLLSAAFEETRKELRSDIPNADSITSR